MYRYGWLLVVLMLQGCGDSKTASLEREVDRLQRQIARLEAENAELRARANALSLDLEHQRYLNKQLQAKATASSPSTAMEKRTMGAVSPASVSSDKPVPEVISEPTTMGQSTSSSATPLAQAAEPTTSPVVSEPAVELKPPQLPDIKPRTAAQKPRSTEPTRATAPEVYEPRPTPEDPYAAFKRPPNQPPRVTQSTEPTAPETQSPRPSISSEKPAVPIAPSPVAAAPSEWATEKPTPKPSGRYSAPASELQMVDVTASHDGDSVRLVGRVVNNTDRPVLHVRIKAVFLDEDGRALYSGEYPVKTGGRLEAGQKSSFEITSPPNPAITRWRLTVLGEQVSP